MSLGSDTFCYHQRSPHYSLDESVTGSIFFFSWSLYKTFCLIGICGSISCKMFTFFKTFKKKMLYR